MLARFADDVRGAVAPLAALFLMVLAPMSGLAVDFIYAINAKQALQEAVDSAVLAVARENPTSQADIDRIANTYFKSNLAERFGFKNLNVAITRQGEGQFVGSAEGEVALFFSGLFGRSGMVTGARSEAKVDLTDLDVVLALDTTGSMNGAKLNALKTSATSFVNTMMTGNNVRAGIVPFARYVNIGLVHRNEPGFAIPADTNSCRMETRRESYNCRNCQRIPRTGTCWNDGTPFSCSWTETRCDCDYRDVTREVCRSQTWRGCVGSRQEPLNTRDDQPATKIPGLLDISCGAPLTRLTDNPTRLRSAINGLVATGETYIPSGLSMGWATLSHRVPFTDGKDPAAPSSKNLMRAIVLMTDGANTASKRAGRADHDGNNASDANRVTRDLCANIKQDDVTVFTVAFSVSDPTIKALLRDCASNPSYAFDAANAADLQTAFDDIADALTRLRLTK